jgi:hypothetical protein
LYSQGKALDSLGYIIGAGVKTAFKVIGSQHDDDQVKGHVASYYGNQGVKSIKVILKGIVPAARSAAEPFFNKLIGLFPRSFVKKFLKGSGPAGFAIVASA